jgi:hypothetical protein
MAQLAGALAATLLFEWLTPVLKKEPTEVLVAHEQELARVRGSGGS